MIMIIGRFITKQNTQNIFLIRQPYQYLLLIGPSYNQPKFSSCATWNTNAITFANSATVGTSPQGIYIDINNTIYVADK